MKRFSAQKACYWLVLLLIFLLFLDVLMTPLSPAFAYFRSDDPSFIRFDSLMATFDYDIDDGLGNLLTIILHDAWQQPYTAVLSFFLLVCGICAAVILVQGIHILGAIADGEPFSPKNSVSLKRTAVCCFIVAAAALARTACSTSLKGVASALFSYTALFIPLFIMAGLLCLVMSGLFCRAAEMKQENDLTI